MNILTTDNAVSQAERERRMAEYRRVGFERKAAAQVVYHEADAVCPWPGCGHRIDGIHFKLNEWMRFDRRQGLLEAWWKGPGLIGRCPKCRSYVLFSIVGKTKVDEPAESASQVLPDDWHLHAYIALA